MVLYKVLQEGGSLIELLTVEQLSDIRTLRNWEYELSYTYRGKERLTAADVIATICVLTKSPLDAMEVTFRHAVLWTCSPKVKVAAEAAYSFLIGKCMVTYGEKKDPKFYQFLQDWCCVSGKYKHKAIDAQTVNIIMQTDMETKKIATNSYF